MTPWRVTHLVDCGQQAGLGHLRRQLVLADALSSRGAVCRFGLSDPEPRIDLGAAVAEVFPWDRSDLPRGGADALVVDSYQVDPARLARGGPVLAVMDDLADRPMAADILINHNAYGESCDYRCYDVGKVLAGPRFSMVSKSFPALRGTPGTAILVSFGATDDGRLSRDLIAALRAQLPHVPILVALMGVAPDHRAALENLGAELRVSRPLEEAMAEARIYVGSAGFSLLEALAAGRPPIACCIADNQRLNVDFLLRYGLPAFEQPSPAEMARAAARCYASPQRVKVAEFDGLGAERVAQEIGAAVRKRRRTR